jgi:hypothetical protein
MKNLRAQPVALCLFVVFACCFIVVAVRHGKSISDLWGALTIGYEAVPLVLAVVGFFVAYGWRWPLFQGWLVPFPNLNGTWQGEIQTTWKNPETGETPGPIPVILTIKQSFVRMSCVMRTAEMCSRSYFADFWLDGDEQVRKLGYSYVSIPLPTVAHRSVPHEGTTIFEIIGSPPTKLKGIYWSSRKTTGEVTLTFREPKLLEEFPSDLGTHPVSGK